MREVDAVTARRLMEQGAPLLDVREISEWQRGRAPGAVHIPLSVLDPADLRTALGGARPVLVICRSGRRSADAVRLFSARGHDAVNVVGGLLAWREAGLPVVADGGADGEVV